jgi:C_GCAxxG_C_C family probable redox protein
MRQPSIAEQVHDAYYVHDWNCARTALWVLSNLYGVEIQPQLWEAAVGMHGAGGHRDQCGLVEGSLLFLGVYFTEKGWSEEAVVAVCNQFAEAFTQTFGSLQCRELRPGGFTDSDPPHLCEELSVKAITFTSEFIQHQTP